MSSRLPALGPRGEGWVVGQVVLFAIIGGAGLRDVALTGLPGSWGWWPQVIGFGMIAGGVFLAGRGSWDLRASFSPFPRPVEGAPLMETGAYRLVRHPIYGGLIIAALGWSLVTSSVLAALATSLLLVLFAAKGRREEALLEAIHPGYCAYRQRSHFLIPWIY